jgi:hypothetical protein
MALHVESKLSLNHPIMQKNSAVLLALGPTTTHYAQQI